MITGGETDPQSDPLQPPDVDSDPTLSCLGATLKSMPMGLPFDAIVQFGALTWTAASWNVTGPAAAKTHGTFAGVTTLATACALIVTYRS